MYGLGCRLDGQRFALPTTSHSFSRRIVQLIELKDREERRRLSWIVAYRERPDAGAVCRRFGISRPTSSWKMENAILRRKRIPHSDYLFRTATHWRMRAEAIRTLAEDAQDSKVRAMMLRIAADHERLASNADDRAAQDSIMFRVVSPDDKTSADAASGHRDGQRPGPLTRRRLDASAGDHRAPAMRSSLSFTPNHRPEGDQ